METTNPGGGDTVSLIEFLMIETKEKCFEIDIKTIKEFNKQKEKEKH